jgi:hypothetical protein
MKAAVRNSLKNIALLLIASLLSLIAMEFAYRFVSGVSLAELKSFRDRDALRKVIGTVAYDPDLGWAFLSNEQIRISIPGGYYAGRPEPWSYNITIGELGIRSNSSERAAIRKGGILAVGDSFTAGSEIDDHGAWPAQLEKIINRPVINGAVGGYGSDQIVMRAESMLPLVVPEVLVVGMLDQDILRVGYSSFGAPKPYYTMEGGKLTLHNSPVPLLNLSEHGVGWTKRVAAHSFVIDQVMSRLFPNTWLAAPKQVFTQTTVDIVDVTCELLKRLKLKTDDLKIRTLLLMQ